MAAVSVVEANERVTEVQIEGLVSRSSKDSLFLVGRYDAHTVYPCRHS
jgi:hypothetical protein